jgi:hypothetical protein
MGVCDGFGVWCDGCVVCVMGLWVGVGVVVVVVCVCVVVSYKGRVNH